MFDALLDVVSCFVSLYDIAVLCSVKAGSECTMMGVLLTVPLLPLAPILALMPLMLLLG